MDDIIYEDVNSEEYLTEMAQIQPKGGVNDFGFLITVNRESRKGVCYFKVYNSTKYQSATKVARICFKSPTLIKNHAEIGGKKEWVPSELNSAFRKDLVRYLNSRDSSHSNLTVWAYMRFYWNELYGFTDDIDDYISGRCDTPENLKTQIIFHTICKCQIILN